MKNTASYTYKFTEGEMTITRGIETSKYDWFVTVKLNNDKSGCKQFIRLNQRVFLTRKHALKTTVELLKIYNLH